MWRRCVFACSILGNTWGSARCSGRASRACPSHLRLVATRKRPLAGRVSLHKIAYAWQAGAWGITACNGSLRIDMGYARKVCTLHLAMPPFPCDMLGMWAAVGAASALQHVYRGLGIVSGICMGVFLVECRPTPPRLQPFAHAGLGMQRGATFLDTTPGSHDGSYGCGVFGVASVRQALVRFVFSVCVKRWLLLFGAPVDYRAHCQFRLGYVVATPAQRRTDARNRTAAEG